LINLEDAERLQRHRMCVGDIVYGRRGDIGRRALVGARENGWLCGTGCLRVSLGQRALYPTYLYYFLGQPKVVAWIENQAVGSTMPNLNTAILRSVAVRYPPHPVQRRVASILSAYDDLTENNTRRIKILEEMAQTLYREWFVNFRFPGCQKAEMVASELGPIPKGWEVRTLGELAKITMGQSPPSSHYNIAGTGLPFHQGVTDFGPRFPTDRTYCSVENRLAQPQDILMSVRAPVGRLNISTKKIVIGRGLCAIRSSSNTQAILFQQLRDHFREEDTMGSGTIFKAVTKQEVHAIRFVKAEDKRAGELELRLGPIFRLLEVLYLKNTNLRTTRDLLLPKLISGEIPVSAVEKALEQIA
jgi:type I restriction enzyme, S subunit